MNVKELKIEKELKLQNLKTLSRLCNYVMYYVVFNYYVSNLLHCRKKKKFLFTYDYYITLADNI